MTSPEGEFLLYQTEDGRSRIEVRFDGDTAWLSLGQLATLFQRDKSVISRHIKNVFDEVELERAAVVAESATTATDGKTYQVEYFNLDVIISVGYRVRSHRGTQFRIWATQRLRELIVKVFTLDDERLKRSGGGNYFDELLARVRDIRSSEKIFWRKVLDIYATSIDYDARAEASQGFFKTIQNKMHWAAHGHTAAEIVAARADATKPNMGLTSFPGDAPRKADVSIAKNYLGPEELVALNRIVNAYLEFAELQAMNRKPMYIAVEAPTNEVAKKDQLVLELKWEDALAESVVRDGQFVVRAGSHARVKEVDSLGDGIRALRKTLRKSGVLSVAEKNPTLLRFTQEYAFDSPSAAAVVVSGTGLNGRTAWKVKASGISYKEWQEQQVNAENVSAPGKQ